MKTHLSSVLMHYLDEVAREGSIRRAAARIYVSPSAVNRQILNLEEQLGVPLFERLPRGVRLTEAGGIILDTIRRFQQDAKVAMSRVEEMRGLRRGHVAIGTLLAMPLVADLIGELRAAYPEISYQLYTGNSEDIVRQIVDGDLEIGLCWAPPPSSPVRRIMTSRVQLGLVMSPDHPLAREEKLSLADCRAHSVIFPARGSAIRYLLDRINIGTGVGLSPTIETNSIIAMKRFAQEGLGISILPPISAEAEIRSGELIYRPFEDPHIPQLRFSLIVRLDRKMTPAADMVIERLKARIKEFDRLAE